MPHDDASEIDLDQLLAVGFDQVKAHTGKSWVSITDAINYFYAQRTKRESLASLSVAYALLTKHGEGMDADVGVPIASKLKNALVDHWHGLL